MKALSCLLAVLVCCEASTDAVAAQLRGHHLRATFAASRSEPHRHDLAKSGTDDSKPQKSTAAERSDAAKKPATTSGSKGAPANIEQAAPHEPHQPVTPSPEASGKKGVANVAIDTRISVRQGRELGKQAKDRTPKKAKPAAVTRPQHVNGNRFARTSHRNAIGANTAPEKTTVQNATPNRSAAAASIVTPAKVDTASSPAITPGDNSKAKAEGVIPPNGPNPSGVQTGNRAAAAAALAIVARNSPSVSGTGLNRPGTSAGAVGGAPKPTAGLISGNSVHLKHP